jgi:hypothetical protein
MQVDGVSPGNAYGLQKVTGKENAPEEPSGEPLSAEVADVSGDEPTGEEEKGVIRLLLEGHFKGVSDVRLRINFNDELTAIEAAQMQAVSGEKMGGVLQSVGGAVDSFLADNELTEEEAAAVSEAKDSFLQAVNGADDPAGAVADAFAIFLELLQELVPPPPEPEPEDVPPDNDGGQDSGTDGDTGPIPLVESGPDWQEFIDNLKSSFSGAMVELTTAVSAANVLPPLSEPNGNGIAYDKFLAIYNEMRGIVPVTLDSAV